MKISVCICTCDRYELLRRLLSTLQNIELHTALECVHVELLIIDNNPQIATEALCQQFADNFPIDLTR